MRLRTDEQIGISNIVVDKLNKTHKRRSYVGPEMSDRATAAVADWPAPIGTVCRYRGPERYDPRRSGRFR